MNIEKHQNMINFIWNIADCLRDHYVKGRYRDVILPMCIIRRLDVVLLPTKEKVLNTYKKLDENANFNILKSIKYGSGYDFYNISEFSLETLLKDEQFLKDNFKAYLRGFSQNVVDIIDKFSFFNEIDKLDKANILYPIIKNFCDPRINFSPNPIYDKDNNLISEGLSNLGMGYVFEELIRKFNEENNEEAGQHFTPREIIKLMTNLIFLPIKDSLEGGSYTIYDNACGSGGMLTEAKDFLLNKIDKNKNQLKIHLHGQEVNPEVYATCIADMLIKGENAQYIKFGSTLSEDAFPNEKFNFMLTNPPYGKNWEEDQRKLGVKKVKNETVCNDDRFKIGITSKSDGQMMFLLNMISKMNPNGIGSRIASIHNGSPLFNSDSGQVAIRSHIIKNDLLEAIIALPTNMFYNTAIPTFIWILTNKKPEHKKGKVWLMNATNYYQKMKKSLGSKSNEMTNEHIAKITEQFLSNASNDDCIILNNDDLGYIKVVVEQVKTLNELQNNESFNKLKDKETIISKLKELEQSPKDFKNSLEFAKFLGVKLSKSELKLLINSDKNTNTEKIPLISDINEYYEKEIKPFMPNSWVDLESKQIGYEILFNKYFYTYEKPRELDEIKHELSSLENELKDLLGEILS